MTVRDMLTALQRLPREAEVLAMEAGCEQYCGIELEDVELQGDPGSICILGSGETPHHAAKAVDFWIRGVCGTGGEPSWRKVTGQRFRGRGLEV